MRSVALGLGLGLGSTIFLAMASSGCSALGGVAAGPAYAIAKEHQSAGALNAYAGVGLGDEDISLGGGGELRVKIGPSIGHFAIGPFAYAFSGGRDSVVTPFLRFGFNLLQFETVESRFAFGMFSPRAEVGVIFRIVEELGMSLGIDGEYVLRFTDTPNTGYASFTIGFAAVKKSGPPPRFSRLY
ncbi:hypothetical protein BH09MYX1_BH09MYX1_32780 [soil metagenome]